MSIFLFKRSWHLTTLRRKFLWLRGSFVHLIITSLKINTLVVQLFSVVNKSLKIIFHWPRRIATYLACELIAQGIQQLEAKFSRHHDQGQHSVLPDIATWGTWQDLLRKPFLQKQNFLFCHMSRQKKLAEEKDISCSKIEIIL